MSVTVHPAKVVYIRRKQGYDYGGGEVSHYKPLHLEYKGYFNPNVPQKFNYHHQQFALPPQNFDEIKQNFEQQFNKFYQQHQANNFEDYKFKQEEPLALFVSKPEEQNLVKQQGAKPAFGDAIAKPPQNQKPIDWESFKLENNGGQALKQEFQPVLQKPPQSAEHFSGYNYQQSSGVGQEKFPPVHNEYYPGLQQPQQPVNLYVGFENFKQNAIQQPAEAAKQNFNAFNLPKLQQQPQTFPFQEQKPEPLPVNHQLFPEQQKIEASPAPVAPNHIFGGHFFQPPKGQDHQFPIQQQVGHDFGGGGEDLKQLFDQALNSIDSQHEGIGIAHQNGLDGVKNDFRRPNEQNIIKFSNEDAVEPQEVGKVQFGNGLKFNNNDFGFGVENINKPQQQQGGLKSKRRPKRVRPPVEPKYTYIIRARRHRD